MQQKLCYPSQNHMGMGRKSHGYGNYTDEATWNMETQAQLQNHNFHDESYSTDNSSFHKQQFPGGMHMKHGGAYATEHSEHSMSKHHGLGKLGGSGINHGMFDSMSGGHGNGYGHGLLNGHGHGFGHAHGGGKKYPFGGANGNSAHHFSNGGGMFNNHGSGHNNGYVSEEYEYEAHNVEHVGGVTEKMDEKRYERHVGGGDAYYANPYGHNRKPHGYGHAGHKVEWTAKGV